MVLIQISVQHPWAAHSPGRYYSRRRRERARTMQRTYTEARARTLYVRRRAVMLIDL